MAYRARKLIQLAGAAFFAALAVAQDSPVTVVGQVAGVPVLSSVLSSDQAYLPLKGDNGRAMLLEAPEFMFDRLAPGDRLEVRGVWVNRNGQPVLRPAQITSAGRAAAPIPEIRRVAELETEAMAGAMAILEGRVRELGENTSGQYLVLEDEFRPYPVYANPPDGLRVGDRVRVVGVAITSTGGYLMVATQPGAVVLISRRWLLQPHTIVTLVVGLMLVAGWRWRRHRQTLLRHRTIRRLNTIAEDVATAASAEEMLRKLSAALPGVMGISVVRLFRFERSSQRLESLEEASVVEASAASLAFRNRTPLLIPETRNSPFAKSPGGLIVLPVLARDELVGAMLLSHPKRIRVPSPEELAALQHAGNQAAITLKLIEGLQRREHLRRSEKLAATGQLIQGVTAELRDPLESIVLSAHRLMDQGSREARAIVNESLRASAILSRLSLVVRGGEEEAQALDINPIVARAVELCRSDWEEMDVELRASLHPRALWVMGSATQLDQVIRNLVSLAARGAVEARCSTVHVATASMAGAVSVTVEYAGAGTGGHGEDSGALGIEVCRGILQGNGGDLKVTHPQGQCRIEVTMPTAFPATRPAAERKRLDRALTAVLLEPDAAVQRRLVSIWTGLGHRALPVSNEAEAVELAGRMRIDAIFCAVRVGSTSWVEIFERTRERVPAFVLLTEGVDSDEAALFPDREGLVLRKPVEAGEVSRLLDRIVERVASPATPALART